MNFCCAWISRKMRENLPRSTSEKAYLLGFLKENEGGIAFAKET